jgi:HAD superfamily phosphoserine phosphatase-like hydrolase
MERVVASDLEGTLTAGSTWRGVGRYLSESGSLGAYRRFLYPRLPLVWLAQRGWIDVQAFRERWMRDLTRLLRGWTEARIDEMAAWVLEHELWPERREAVIAELEAARDEGARLILASGTYQPVLRVFAERIGAEALGTELAYVDGRATGRFAGMIGTGEEKAARLAATLGGATLEAAYGDSAADIPMLESAAAAVAVHPEPDLERVARARGWRILVEPPAASGPDPT